jgi:lipoyl(octanoyl) transferase
MNIEIKKSIKPIKYKTAIDFLEKRLIDINEHKAKDLIWLLEHEEVYTAGTSYSKNEILNKNIKIIKTKRGGKATLHSKGQKVIYFVLNLNRRKKDIRNLVTNIENCIIKSLKHYNVKSFRDKKNIGIWVNSGKNNKKIAAIGIRVKKWIAYHGFSINVSNNLKYYKSIIPCGIKNKGITSLKEIGIREYKDINKIVVKNFLNIFL